MLRRLPKAMPVSLALTIFLSLTGAAALAQSAYDLTDHQLDSVATAVKMRTAPH